MGVIRWQCLLPGLCSALIIPQHISLTCEPGSVGHVEGKTGCLRGQVCIAEDVCAVPNNRELSKVNLRQTTSGAPRPDGRCGSSFDDAVCDCKWNSSE